MQKILSFLIGIFLFNSVLASNFITLTVPPKQAKLFWLHNVSQQTVGLDTTKHPGASAGWSTMIDAGFWSVILLSNSNNTPMMFSLTCTQQKVAGQMWQTVSCENVIKTAEVKNATMPADYQDGSQGSFWVVEDVKDISNKAILMRLDN